MRGIGRGGDVGPPHSLGDRMLAAWARARLLPRNTEPTPSAPPPEVGPGTVLCSAVTPGSGVPAERFLLRDQFLHKAVLVVLGELPGGAVSACVLNRPTSSTRCVSPRRCVSTYPAGLPAASSLAATARSAATVFRRSAVTEAGSSGCTTARSSAARQSASRASTPSRRLYKV